MANRDQATTAPPTERKTTVTQLVRVTDKPPPTITAVPDLNTMMLVAKTVADSRYFSETNGPAQAMVKILAGHEMGVSPIASMTGIHLVKGKITLGSNLMAAKVRSSGRYDYRVKHLDDQRCEIEFLMDGKPLGLSTFTIEDAKKAGLAGGDNYRKYPRNMLFARAMRGFQGETSCGT
jgi:hypothetical protein